MRASTDDILPSKRLCSIEEVISFLFGSANKFFLKTRFNFCFMDESDFTPIKYSINLMWPSIFCYFIPMFLVAIYPSNAFSRRMRLTLSTDTKLDKLHSSISWLTDIFGWSFSVLISLPSFAVVFEEVLDIDRSNISPVTPKLRKNLRNCTSWYSKFRSYFPWLIFRHLHYIHTGFFCVFSDGFNWLNNSNNFLTQIVLI